MLKSVPLCPFHTLGDIIAYIFVYVTPKKDIEEGTSYVVVRDSGAQVDPTKNLTFYETLILRTALHIYLYYLRNRSLLSVPSFAGFFLIYSTDQFNSCPRSRMMARIFAAAGFTEGIFKNIQNLKTFFKNQKH